MAARLRMLSAASGSCGGSVSDTRDKCRNLWKVLDTTCAGEPPETTSVLRRLNFSNYLFGEMAKWGEGDPRWIVEERADATNVNNWHW